MDVWNDDDGADSHVAALSIARLQERHEKEGYIAGLELGKERSIQKGFDEGYTLAMKAAVRIGCLKAKVEAMIVGRLLVTVEGEVVDGSQIEGRDEQKHLELLQSKIEQLNARNLFTGGKVDPILDQLQLEVMTALME
jgi:Essential protein Yae1, N terminal